MSTVNKSFCIICIANYCRSPVLEILLKKEYPEYEFYSAGLSPLFEPRMDPRSQKFLEENNIKNIIHTPKKLNKKILNYFDLIIPIDIYVMHELCRIYPKYVHKFRLATLQFKDTEINDPYLLSDEEYKDIMLKIRYVAKNINLDIL